MGFPMGYTEVYLPKFLIYFLTILGLIRKLIFAIFRFIGLSDFLEPEFSTNSTQPESLNPVQSASGLILRELLPIVKYSDLVDPPESCAVCLYEFEGRDEVRQLTNCRHIFHRSCLDRWMDHDQKTCPLCRSPFVSDELRESFNERLWAVSGVGDYYGLEVDY